MTFREYFTYIIVIAVFVVGSISCVKERDVWNHDNELSPRFQEYLLTNWNDSDFEGRSRRLPNTTYPIHYYLHINTKVHREIFEYNGNCTIEILVSEDTDELVLHALFLENVSIALEDLTAKTEIPNVKYRQVGDFLIITSEDASNATTTFQSHHILKVQILYTSQIMEGNVGFHKLTYKDENNNTVICASTQFEPIYARSLMPCYDEPAFKSNFTMSITHGKNFTAISNMPQLDTITESDDDMVTTVFQDTPPMSSYLLAFIICNLVRVRHDEEGDLLQRVFVPPSTPDHKIPTLENVTAILRTYEKWFGIPYTLPKLDHVAVHESYGNAMENWGLITYKESVFLCENNKDMKTTFNRLMHQAHEVAHQWFGNLVSPAWWNHLWLNEGFATYYSYEVLNSLFPHYEAMQVFATDVCYQFTYFPRNISISNYIEEPRDVVHSFVDSNYLKAPCIIQMFEHAFGKETFREALAYYLNANSYSDASADDLYSSLQSVISTHWEHQNRNWNYSVEDFMDSWMSSTSLPIIEVTRDYDSNVLHIRQWPLSNDTTLDLWWIPLNFATASQPNFEDTTIDYYMPPVSEVTIDLNDLNITLKPDDWLLVNKLGIGLYYVKYDFENVHRITRALLKNHNVIHKLQRSKLLHDFATLFVKGYLDILDELELMTYLRTEDDLFVWAVKMPSLIGLFFDVEYSKSEKALKKFINSIIEPFYKNVLSKYKTKPKGELNIAEMDVSIDMETMCCLTGLPACLLEKRKFIERHMNGLEDEEGDKIGHALCYATKTFTDDEFERAFDFYTQRGDHDNAWHYLSCTLSQKNYEKLVLQAVDIQANDTLCKSKLQFIYRLLFAKGERQREFAWSLLDEKFRTILETAPCEFTICCDELYSLYEVGNNEEITKKLKELLQICEDRRLKVLREQLEQTTAVTHDEITADTVTPTKSYLISEEDMNIEAPLVIRGSEMDIRMFKWLQKQNEVFSDVN